MNLFYPTQKSEPGIQRSKEPFPGWAGSVSKACQQHERSISVVSSLSHFPPLCPCHTQARQHSKCYRGLLLHFPLLLYLGELGELWLAGSALAKPLKFKRLSHVLQNTFFFFPLEHCSFALAGTAGQDRYCGKEVTPVVLCAAIRKLWAELHCAGIDSHLPRIITPELLGFKSVSLLWKDIPAFFTDRLQ